MSDRSKALALTRMLWCATHDRQRFNNDLAYATVPPEITQRSEAFIQQISVAGEPVSWPVTRSGSSLAVD